MMYGWEKQRVGFQRLLADTMSTDMNLLAAPVSFSQKTVGARVRRGD